MNYGKTSYNGTNEILATDKYYSVPIKVATPDSGTVVKAGTPLTEEGAVTTGANAIGILLYDVDVNENPNGAIVVNGFIDTEKAQEWSGITYASALYSALPGVKFRDNIGVNGGGGGDDDVVGTAIVGTSKVRAA